MDKEDFDWIDDRGTSTPTSRRRAVCACGIDVVLPFPSLPRELHRAPRAPAVVPQRPLSDAVVDSFVNDREGMTPGNVSCRPAPPLRILSPLARLP